MKEEFKRFRNFLLFFSSEDYYLIKNYRNSLGNTKKEIKEKKTLNAYFTLIGLFVFVLFVGTTFSFIIFVFNVLEGYSKMFSIPIGVFLGLLIANIYYFLLYTISPVILPKADQNKKKDKKIIDLDNREERQSLFSLSFIFRFLFIAFIAFIISQPLSEFVVFNALPDKFAIREKLEIERYRAETIASAYILKDDLLIQKEKENLEQFVNIIEQSINFSNSDRFKLDSITYTLENKYEQDEIFINQLKSKKESLNKIQSINLFNRDETQLEYLINEINTLTSNEIAEDEQIIAINSNIIFDDSKLNDAYNKAFENWKKITTEKLRANKEILEVFNRNTFYTLKLKLLISNNIISLIISIGFVVAFSIPIVFKFWVRKRFDYYTYKAKIEEDIILKDYQKYLLEYEEVLNYRIQKQINTVNLNLSESLSTLKMYNGKAYSKIQEEINNYTVNILPIQKFEYWADPPFRTKRKKEKNYKTEQDLLNKIYQEWN